MDQSADYKTMVIRGNASTNAAIHWRYALGTLANSASTGTPKYYAYETRYTIDYYSCSSTSTEKNPLVVTQLRFRVDLIYYIDRFHTNVQRL
jgi:hypothetical protein